MGNNSEENLAVDVLPGYPPEIGRWLWVLEATRRRLKEALDGLDEAAVDWVRPEGGNSIGSLLYHIAAIEADWLYTEALEADFPAEVIDLFPDDVRNEAGELTTANGLSLAEHLQRLDTVRAFFLNDFRTMTLEDFRRLRHFEQYNVTAEWVVHHLIQHEAEHRGQILEIRRGAEQS